MNFLFAEGAKCFILRLPTPMFGELKKWAGFVRISHTLFALPFALAAMLVAAREHRGWPGFRVFGLILLAMFCARTCATWSAACWTRFCWRSASGVCGIRRGAERSPW